MPKISIIIAVYNVEKYLKQCLDSLVNQTFKDIEIICTDDGSTDNSLNILKEYQSRDSRIKIIEQENQGPGVARNNAIEAANGKYIMIVDPDDWLELNACELAYNQIEKNQNDFVMFDWKICEDETCEVHEEPNHLLPYKDVIDNPHINISDLKKNFFQNGFSWAKLYNKNFLIDNNIEYAPLYLCEDIPFVMKSLILSRDTSIINTPLYVYRKRKDSACSVNKRWQELLIARKLVAEFILEHSERISNNIINNYIEYSVNSLSYWYNKFGTANPEIKKQFKKEIIEYFKNFSQYNNFRISFKQYLFKHEIIGLFYYKLFRPIGKYCIVLPYRKIKNFFKGN